MQIIFRVISALAGCCVIASTSHAGVPDEIFANGFEFVGPVIYKAFSPASVQTDANSVLTIVFDNTASTTAATLSADFVDHFPSGLVIATPADAWTTCDLGMTAATAGGNSVKMLAGAHIPAAATCNVTVSVVAAAAATYTNTIAVGSLQTDHGRNAYAAEADLVVGANACPNQLLLDPGLEATDAVSLINPFWAGTSSNFTTPICSLDFCGNYSGTAGPRDASTFWAWFGGANGQMEDAAISQVVTIPQGSSAHLSFELWVGKIGGGGASLEVTVDGTQVALYREPSVVEAGYNLRTINVSAYADGALHTVRLHYYSSLGAATSNFNVDDVRLNCAAASPMATRITR